MIKNNYRISHQTENVTKTPKKDALDLYRSWQNGLSGLLVSITIKKASKEKSLKIEDITQASRKQLYLKGYRAPL